MGMTWLLAGLLAAGIALADDASVVITRLGDGPIIHPALHPSIGANIQGPSLIRVPEWVENPLGRYYLYFADHKGAYIRLAYADAVTGPWRIHAPGSLQLVQSHFLTKPPTVSAEEQARIEAAFARSGIRIEHDILQEVTTPHIASPDVHVDEVNRRIIMYFHGLEDVARQITRVAESRNGIDFRTHPRVLGRTYLRVFGWRGEYFGLAMPGQLYRAADRLGPFSEGPLLFNPDMRHNAVLVRDGTLYVFWTQVGDAPEHIKLSTIELAGDWLNWQATAGVEVLRPQRSWEGSGAPVLPSMRSTAYGVVNQLRDPAVFVDGEKTYLLYAVGGESGIAIAEVEFSGGA